MFYSKKIKKFKNLYHCFFSKKNGFSKGIYNSLNCGLGSNDNNDDVNKNLNFVSKNIDIKQKKLILMNQTHGNKVAVIDENNLSSKKINSDALITQLKDTAICVLTADCVPLILYDESSRTIGCVHAGWKGALNGVIKNTIDKFKEISRYHKITASIGPCIGFDSYEVGIEFRQNFLKELKTNERFFKRKNQDKFLFNIREYVQSKLIDCGVKNIDNVEADTFKDFSNFFSHRRSKTLGEPDYGRCISTICLKT